MPLKIQSREKSIGSFAVALDGRLDSDSYRQLEGLLEQLFRTSVRELRFDLARLDYISSMGLRVLLKTAKSVQGTTTSMVMTGMQPQIRKVFEIANVLPSFSIFESVEEADHYFDQMQRQVLDRE